MPNHQPPNPFHCACPVTLIIQRVSSSSLSSSSVAVLAQAISTRACCFFSRRQATIHAITHIMKLVLLSKLDEQAACGLRHDALVNEMIVDHVSSSRKDFVLRVAICLDGRQNPETGLDFWCIVIISCAGCMTNIHGT